jgi:hypothetical protein
VLFLEIENSFDDPGIETDVLQNPEFLRNAAKIPMDLFSALQALRGQERLEAVRVLDEIGITSGPVPSMRMPDTAQVVVGLKNGVGNVIGVKVIGCADAGNSGADDDDVPWSVHDISQVSIRKSANKPSVAWYKWQSIRFI